MFTLEAFLLIEALHSSVKSFRSGLLELGLWAVTVHAKHLVWFLTPSRSLRRGKRGGPRQHLGPLWNQDSLEQRHFTHCFSKHLIELLLHARHCVRHWGYFTESKSPWSLQSNGKDNNKVGNQLQKLLSAGSMGRILLHQRSLSSAYILFNWLNQTHPNYLG